MTPGQRILRSRIGAYRRWANESNPTAATAPARSAFLQRFLDEVDPDRVLPEAERTRRATAARKAYMQQLALRSSVARQKKAATSRHEVAAEEVDRGSDHTTAEAA
jgi:hypothetical protein